MKLKLLLLFLTSPLFSFAQKKGYISGAFGKDFPDYYHAPGLHFTANKKIANNLFIGPGAAIVKFDHIKKAYFPVFLNFSWKGESKKKVFPIAFVQPGYGFYKYTTGAATTKGGFTFHTSAGAGYPFLFGTKGFASIGYSYYTFITNNFSDTKNAFGARVGIILEY